MASLDGYAIVDVAEGSASVGKVLVLLDDEATAEEMAAELRHRGCGVMVKAMSSGRQSISRPAGGPNTVMTAASLAAVSPDISVSVPT